MEKNTLKCIHVIFLGIIALGTSYIAFKINDLIEGLWDITQALGVFGFIISY